MSLVLHCFPSITFKTMVLHLLPANPLVSAPDSTKLLNILDNISLTAPALPPPSMLFNAYYLVLELYLLLVVLAILLHLLLPLISSRTAHPHFHEKNYPLSDW